MAWPFGCRDDHNDPVDPDDPDARCGSLVGGNSVSFSPGAGPGPPVWT